MTKNHEIPDMNQATHFSGAPYERQTISTVGEIDKWLHEQAVGSTESAADYVDALKSLSDAATEADNKDLREAVLLLAGQIGRRSEKRMSELHRSTLGGAPIDIEGIDAIREVNDADIMLTTTEFDPEHPNYKGYTDRDSKLVPEIDHIIRDSIRDLKRQKPQE